MPSRWSNDQSRWSGQSERDERERQRRLSDAQKASGQSRRSWRHGTTPDEPVIDPDLTVEQARTPASSEEPHGPETIEVTDKWRRQASRAGHTTLTDAGELPDLDGQRRASTGRSVSTPIIVLGLLLAISMVAMQFLPFGPFSSDADPTPIPTAVPTSPVQDPDNRGQAANTPEPSGSIQSDHLVCIDPGHGGWDLGRQRMDQDTFDPPYFHESEINLAMGLMLRDELESRGIAVVMTRETGTSANVFEEDVNGDGRTIRDSRQDGDRDELQRRINICNEAGADILISIHLNGFDDQSANGYQIFYTGVREFGDQSRQLGDYIYRAMFRAFETAGYDAYGRDVTDDVNVDANMSASNEYSQQDHFLLTGPAVNSADFSIVPSNMPGVIIEALFVTNNDDANFIVNPENQALLVDAYADGIETWFEQNP